MWLVVSWQVGLLNCLSVHLPVGWLGGVLDCVFACLLAGVLLAWFVGLLFCWCV